MDAILGIIRHILTFLGGALVARGIIDASMIPEIVGAIMTIVGLIASYMDKRNRNNVTQPYRGY